MAGGGQVRAIRDRIKSVASTAKVTRAMELVAASKMRRAQDRAVQAGVEASIDVWPQMPHVFPLFDWLPESRQAMSDIAAFIAKNLARSNRQAAELGELANAEVLQTAMTMDASAAQRPAL